jgi:bifunctional non-homologous end joining protein LigD
MTVARSDSITAGNIRVELSNTGKVFFPGDEITKGDLIGYYRDVAGRMLPYLRDRPIAMARYPDGINGQRIFQKNVPDYFPDWVSRALR